MVLAALKADIEKRRIRLSELRLRERRTTLASTLYALAGWGLYVSLWYMEVLPRLGFGTATDQLLHGAPVFIGPILCAIVSRNITIMSHICIRVLLVRRLVQMWYKRKGDAEGACSSHVHTTRTDDTMQRRRCANYPNSNTRKSRRSRRRRITTRCAR